MIKAKMKSWSHSAKEKVGTKIRALKGSHRDVPAERAETERDHAAAGTAAAVEAMESSAAAPVTSGYPVQEATGAAVPPTSDSSERLLPLVRHTAAAIGREVVCTTADIGSHVAPNFEEVALNVGIEVAANLLGAIIIPC